MFPGDGPSDLALIQKSFFMQIHGQEVKTASSLHLGVNKSMKTPMCLLANITGGDPWTQRGGDRLRSRPSQDRRTDFPGGQGERGRWVSQVGK